SIPWDGLFEPKLNFYLEHDTKTNGYRIRNRSPLPGEQDYYGSTPNNNRTFPNDMGVQASYAYLALLPNLTGTGNVLIISGMVGADTEAASELITGPGFATTLSKILRSKAGKPPAPYV